MNNLRVLGLTVALAALLLAATAHAGIEQRADVKGFINRMVAEHAFDPAALEKVFRQVQLQPNIITAITRPAESKPWYQYRPIFLTESRIRQGAAFWNRNAAALEKAEQTYGVAPEVIVAILGVETRYGRHTGSYRVADALSTLAFNYPPRAAFFGRQLEQFMLMAREEGVDPLSLKGSYAGAMGKAQFMPSSFRSYAVDFDHDGRRDLWNDATDAIGSIANYFQRNGWQRGQPIAYPARVANGDLGDLLGAGLKPTLTPAQLKSRGVTFTAQLADDTPVALLTLESSDGKQEYWVTLQNFYAITRYNRSPLYAMAVTQLAEAISSLRHAHGST